MGNLSGESREQNRKDKVTRFRSVTYARQLGLLVNTLGSRLKPKLHQVWRIMLCVFLLLYAIHRPQSRTPFDVVRWSAVFSNTE